MLISEPGRISDHIDMIGTSDLPVYILKGEKWAAVDAGVSITGPHIVQQLTDMADAGKRIQYLVVTHSHFDHVGALPALMRAFPDAEVVGSEVTARVFKKPAAMAYIKAMNDSFVKVLGFEKQFPQFDFSFPGHIEVHRVVGEGDSLDLGDGVTLDVHETPGHSRCSLAYFLKPDMAVFSGESMGFYNARDEIISEGLSSFQDYLDSLKKMAGLGPEIICLPHNGALVGDDAKNYFSMAAVQGEEFRADLKGRLEEGQADEHILEEITQLKYHGLITRQPREVFTSNLRAMINAVRKEMS